MFTIFRILLILTFAAAALSTCRMPSEIPDDLRDLVSTSRWRQLMDMQMQQIRANGGCENAVTSHSCTVERVIEKHFPGVCQVIDEVVPECVYDLERPRRSKMFHKDCLFLMENDSIVNILRLKPKIFQAFVQSLHINNGEPRSTSGACNITVKMVENHPGMCVSTPAGYACRANETADISFDSPTCKSLGQA